MASGFPRLAPLAGEVAASPGLTGGVLGAWGGGAAPGATCGAGGDAHGVRDVQEPWGTESTGIYGHLGGFWRILAGFWRVFGGFRCFLVSFRWCSVGS